MRGSAGVDVIADDSACGIGLHRFLQLKNAAVGFAGAAGNAMPVFGPCVELVPNRCPTSPPTPTDS